MSDADRRTARRVPGFRPCAACDEPMDINALYSFHGGEVRCICLPCYRLFGFYFGDGGEVVRRREIEVV